MADCYRRDGTPYKDYMEWAQDFEKHDMDKKRVASTILPNGKWVSTVWVGLNYNYGDGPPLIFETMVFPSKTELSDLDMERYSTEAEALVGHEAMVKKWSSREAS